MAILHLAFLATVGAEAAGIGSFVLHSGLSSSWIETMGIVLGAAFLLGSLGVLGFVALFLWFWVHGSGRALLAIWDAAAVVLFILVAGLITSDRPDDALQALVERLPLTLAAILFGVVCTVSALLVAPPSLHAKADPPVE